MPDFIANVVDVSGNPLFPDGSSTNRRRSGFGGVINNLSGLGGARDKGDATKFLASIFADRVELETLYVESWAAAAMIDIPVDDMFARFREFSELEPDDITKVEDLISELEIKKKLAKAVKAARLYGGAIMVLMIEGAGDTDEELDIERVSEGSLKNVLVFDRFDVEIDSTYSDPMHPQFGMPEIYSVYPRTIGFVDADQSDRKLLMKIHASRCLRFDGKESLGTFGWEAGYDEEWGVSELIPAVLEIGHEAGLSGVIAHLTQEAEIMLVQTAGYRDSLSGMPKGPDEPTPTEIATDLIAKRSTFGVMFGDVTDRISRLTVNVGGLSGLMNEWHELLAAIARIPLDRFLSRTPTGWENGTAAASGWALSVKAMQERILDNPLRRKLDKIIARSVGLEDDLQYKWLSLVEMSDMNRLEMEEKKSSVLLAAQAQMNITEDEYRDRMSGSEIFGVLDPMPDDLMSEMEFLSNPPAPEVAATNGRG